MGSNPVQRTEEQLGHLNLANPCLLPSIEHYAAITAPNYRTSSLNKNWNAAAKNLFCANLTGTSKIHFLFQKTDFDHLYIVGRCAQVSVTRCLSKKSPNASKAAQC